VSDDDLTVASTLARLDPRLRPMFLIAARLARAGFHPKTKFWLAVVLTPYEPWLSASDAQLVDRCLRGLHA
jgi:hypothetical protein